MSGFNPFRTHPKDILALIECDMQRSARSQNRDKEIATELFISPATVKRHASTIYQKLQVNGRQQAVEKAIALGVRPSSV